MAIDTNTSKGKLVVGGIGVVAFLVGILIGHLVTPRGAEQAEIIATAVDSQQSPVVPPKPVDLSPKDR